VGIKYTETPAITGHQFVARSRNPVWGRSRSFRMVPLSTVTVSVR